eukprot:m.106445 g.106445  ORF g.106445 m.106445 type:complete len:67 (+) comp27722_c0_seq1:853-1053(+)
MAITGWSKTLGRRNLPTMGLLKWQEVSSVHRFNVVATLSPLEIQQNTTNNFTLFSDILIYLEKKNW